MKAHSSSKRALRRGSGARHSPWSKDFKYYTIAAHILNYLNTIARYISPHCSYCMSEVANDIVAGPNPEQIPDTRISWNTEADKISKKVAAWAATSPPTSSLFPGRTSHSNDERICLLSSCAGEDHSQRVLGRRRGTDSQPDSVLEESRPFHSHASLRAAFASRSHTRPKGVPFRKSHNMSL